MQLGKQVSGDNVPMIYFWMMLCLLVSVAVATLMYRVVEAPSLSLAASFSQRQFASPATASTLSVQPAIQLQQRDALASDKSPSDHRVEAYWES